MIKVSVKLKNKPGFTVPLPYFLLRTGGWVVTSELFLNLVNKAVKEPHKEKGKSWIPASIDRKELNALIKTAKHYKGLTVVDVQDKDGARIVVKL